MKCLGISVSEGLKIILCEGFLFPSHASSKFSFPPWSLSPSPYFGSTLGVIPFNGEEISCKDQMGVKNLSDI